MDARGGQGERPGGAVTWLLVPGRSASTEGMTDRTEIPAGVLERLRAASLVLLEAAEEEAWTGTRWVVGRKTFAHVGHRRRLATRLRPGRGHRRSRHRAHGPAERAGADAAGGGPAVVRPPWHPDAVGLVLGDGVDWDEVAELVADSHRLMVPRAGAAGPGCRRLVGPPPTAWGGRRRSPTSGPWPGPRSGRHPGPPRLAAGPGVAATLHGIELDPVARHAARPHLARHAGADRLVLGGALQPAVVAHTSTPVDTGS